MAVEPIPFAARRLPHPSAYATIESHAADIQSAVRSAHDRNETARLIDAQGDLLAEKLDGMLVMVRNAGCVREQRHLLSIMRNLLDEIRRLDDLEDEHRDANDSDCLKADRANSQIVSTCERQLIEAHRLGLCGADGGPEGAA